MADGGALLRTQPIDHKRQTETSSRAHSGVTTPEEGEEAEEEEAAG